MTKQKGLRSHERPLTNKEILFCGAYVISGNAEQAAITAGYGLTYAKKRAYELPKKPKLAAYIAELTAAKKGQVERAVVQNSQAVVGQLALIAMADPVSYLKERGDGTFVRKRPDELEPFQRAAVKRVILQNRYHKGALVGQDYDYQLYDKMEALFHLGKHFGVFDDQGSKNEIPLEEFANMPEETLIALGATIQRAIEGTFERIEHTPPGEAEEESDGALLSDG